MFYLELLKYYGNRGYFVWVLLFIKKKIVESIELIRIMFELSGLIGKWVWLVLLKCILFNVYIFFFIIDFF